MAFSIKIPVIPVSEAPDSDIVVAAAKLIKGDYSLRYWDEMRRPGTPVAQKVFPPGGTILTVGSGVISGIDLAAGERGVVWCRNAGGYALKAVFVVGGKRYETSSDPGWTDPDPGSIRARPSTYSPPGTGTGQAAA